VLQVLRVLVVLVLTVLTVLTVPGLKVRRGGAACGPEFARPPCN